MTQTLIFRCNASPHVGIGHLMRCREIARLFQLRGGKSILLGPPHSMQTISDEALFSDWQEIPERGSCADDAARVLAACKLHGTQYVVMDDYRISPEYQGLLRAAGVRWLQQFDASAPFDFWCDLLVNASPYEKRNQYSNWLKRPREQKTLFGPAYAVLRPEFQQISARDPERPVRRILVAFGGGDDRGAIKLTLDALADHLGQGVSLVVVCGPANPRLPQISERIEELESWQAELQINPPDMAGLIQSCDLALIAGGTMSYEAAICGVAMIFIGLASNQERPCRGWTDLTGAPYLGSVETVTAEQIRDTVVALMHDDARRSDIARAGRMQVDGQGAERLLDELLTIP